MADYISREAAIEALRPYKVDPFKIGFLDDTIDGFNDGIDTAISALSVMPAADVRPVAHGTWIVTDHGGYQLIECDQCHAQMWNHQSELPNYCYECGADMRKVVEIDQVKEDNA